MAEVPRWSRCLAHSWENTIGLFESIEFFLLCAVDAETFGLELGHDLFIAKFIERLLLLVELGFPLGFETVYLGVAEYLAPSAPGRIAEPYFGLAA